MRVIPICQFPILVGKTPMILVDQSFERLVHQDHGGIGIPGQMLFHSHHFLIFYFRMRFGLRSQPFRTAVQEGGSKAPLRGVSLHSWPCRVQGRKSVLVLPLIRGIKPSASLEKARRRQVLDQALPHGAMGKMANRLSALPTISDDPRLQRWFHKSKHLLSLVKGDRQMLQA